MPDLTTLREVLSDSDFAVVSLQEPYTNPLASISCWHVHCEECWLRTLVSFIETFAPLLFIFRGPTHWIRLLKTQVRSPMRFRHQFKGLIRSTYYHKFLLSEFREFSRTSVPYTHADRSIDGTNFLLFLSRERKSCVRSAIWLPRRLTLGEFTCDNDDDVDPVPRDRRSEDKRHKACHTELVLGFGSVLRR